MTTRSSSPPPVHHLATLDEAVECLVWSSDGTDLAAGDLGGNVTLVPVSHDSDRSAAPDRSPHGQGVLSAAWHPLRRLLAAGHADGTTVLHDLDTDDAAIIPTGGRTHDLAWSPGGDLLAIAAGPQVLMVDATGSHITTFPSLPGTVHSLGWVHGPAPLAAGTRDGVAWLSPAATTPAATDPARGAALLVTPDWARQRLAVADLAGELHLHDYDAGHEVHVRGWDHIAGLAWSPSGDRLAVAEGPEITVWRLDGVHLLDDEPIRLHAHDGAIRAAAYHGRVLVTAGEDGRVVFWPPQRLHDPVVHQLTAPIRALAAHPHARQWAAGTAAGDVYRIDAP